jgi:hypothetical protein
MRILEYCSVHIFILQCGINNDILFGDIDAFGNAYEGIQQHTEEHSRINVNNAKTIANTAKETASEYRK